MGSSYSQKAKELKQFVENQKKIFIEEHEDEEKPTELDYSASSYQKKLVSNDMLKFLELKLKGNTDKDEIKFLEDAILDSKIDLIVADVVDIQERILNFQKQQIQSLHPASEFNSDIIQLENEKEDNMDNIQEPLSDLKKHNLAKSEYIDKRVNDKINKKLDLKKVVIKKLRFK